MSGAWTTRELFRLVDLYAEHSAEEAAKELGRTVLSVRAAVKRYGFTKVQPKRRQPWTPAEIEKLRELYPDSRASEVAKVLGRDVGSVHRKARDLGVRKSVAFKERERGLARERALNSPAMIAARFHKGQTPKNKGLRRPGWHCGRMRETQFKKGQKSPRTFPVGHIGPDPEGFLRVKVREPLYPNEPYTHYRVLYAWQVWEQHTGKPVPGGHVIRYRDGNRANCAFGNLELISLKENRLRNSMCSLYPPELAKTIQLNGALKRKLRKQNAKEE